MMKTTLLLSVLCAALTVAASITCGSDTCADDEYCDAATTTCLCNLTFYNLTGSTPSPNATCDGGKFNIDVSKCWLETNGYNTTGIRLISTDALCTASREVINGTSWMGIHRPLTTGDCDTATDLNATHLTYRNQLYIFAKTNPIQTKKDVFMNLSCSYPLTINVMLNMTLHPILGTTEIYGPNASASYAVYMIAYKDSSYSIPLTETDTIYVEDFIYIAVTVPGLDTSTSKLKVLTMTAYPDNSTTVAYNVLQNGCPGTDVPADQIIVGGNGQGSEARFKLKVFKISGAVSVLLSAEVSLCSSNCDTICGTKTASVRSPSNTRSVSISLFASENFYDVSSGSSSLMPWTLSALIFSWILAKLL